MLVTAAVIFALAALGGLVLAALHLQDKPIPLPLALLHGLLGACGLVLLALAVAHAVVKGFAGIALGLFVLAALGGFYVFSFQLRKLKLPTPGVILHALIAGTGFVLLIAAILRP
ncbi:MAG: hypothetical protein PHF00_08510 [Elusimicrobia bacterium]|nr:hypothetical protein [Elusimicrobiota bacterium]